MCAQSPFWSLLLSALKGPALFITDQLIPAGRPGRGELGSPQGLRLGWAAKGSRASPGRWRRELRARRMCWRVSRGARPKGRRRYLSGLLGCLRPGAPALELPHTVSVFGLQLITNHSTPYSTAHGPSQQSHNRDCSSLCFRHNKLRSLNQEQEAVLPGSLTGALLASGLSLCLAAFVLLLVTLEPGDETSGIPSLSASYADTVAAPSRVSCRI
ncbi:hypothetical protein ABFV05_007576 [Capra hircus]